MPNSIQQVEKNRGWLKTLNGYFESQPSIQAQTNVDVYNPKITIYTSQTINELLCDEKSEISFLKKLMENGVSHYIENINADVNLLKIDNHFIPILITSGSYNNSYICSPYNHYISLAKLPFSLIKNTWKRSCAFFALQLFGSLVKAGDINRVVYINHSLFSTDLQPNDLSKQQIEHLVFFLKNNFPQHTIIFRSINTETCLPLHKKLKSSCFNFIASRQIYITETKIPELFKTRIIKSDLKLWNESSYDVVDQENFSEEDEKRVLELYHMLAIERHSEFNPKLNAGFLKLLKTYPNFHMKALKKDHVIQGVVGYCISKENILLCPLFGYDLADPHKTHIYRLLSTFLLLEAKKNGAVFHQSAGASFYKTVRRAKSLTEYQGIYIKHLAFKQKLTWHLLRGIINLIAIPFMKKY